MSTLKKGDKAPDFRGKDQDGNEITLAGLKGKKVILYFYPKDDTPGCTAEACNLRDNHSSLQKEGYVVLGVSADDEKSHSKFAGKYQLPFPLLADTEKKIIRDYGAWGEKKNYGKTYEGILRKTFVISPEGKIEKIIDQVKTNDHTKQILEEI